MNASQSSSNSRQRLLVLSTLAALVLAACDKAPQAPVAAPVPDAPVAVQPVPSAAPVARAPAEPVRSAAPAPAPAPQAVAEPYPERPQAVYTEYRAPISQPAPIAVPWAPPAMRVEEIPSQPSPDATWAGGYWVWREGWVWAPGYWATPPRPRYHWVPPYYEHRQDRVVFVDGFWSPPGVGFVRPAVGVTIALAAIGAAVAVGHPPIGPEGVFVPPPPGSRPGLLVPAPLGTSPAVVVRAPAIVAPGMRVSTTVNRIDDSVHTNVRNTTINNNRNTTVVNNISNVTIEAPAATTANHQPVRVNVPSQPHLAAAMATRESAPQVQHQQQPQPQSQPPARHAEPARQAGAQPVDENAMKRALPVNRSAAPAQAIAPPMHAERAAAPEPHRANEAAPAPAIPRAPQARPAPPVVSDHRPAPPAQEHAARPPAPAPQAVHNAPPPHPSDEKARPHEADQHKPGGDRREEGAHKEREPR